MIWIVYVLLHSYTCTVVEHVHAFTFVYLVAEQILVVAESRHHLSLGATMVVSFCLTYLAQLLVQGFLLKLEFLSVASLQAQLLLQGTYHPALCLQLIHLWEGQKGTWWWMAERASQFSIKCQLQHSDRQKMTIVQTLMETQQKYSWSYYFTWFILYKAPDWLELWCSSSWFILFTPSVQQPVQFHGRVTNNAVTEFKLLKI